MVGGKTAMINLTGQPWQLMRGKMLTDCSYSTYDCTISKQNRIAVEEQWLIEHSF